MFDYVKRSELDGERALRLRAEAEREAARAENARLLEMLESERGRFDQFLLNHHAQLETVLKHTAPLAPDLTQTLGGNETGQGGLSALEQALIMPAIGPHGVEAKRNLIAVLRQQELVTNQQAGIPSSDTDLSPGETRRVAEAVGNK